MGQHFWITGTDTNIGKTLVTTYLMRYFQSKGASVLPYKPIQTGIIVENTKQYYEDTAFYQSFSKDPLVEEHLNSYSFKEPASPHYAANLEGCEIKEEIIMEHIRQLKSLYDYVLCEGAGGLYVPLSDQRPYYLLDLIKQSQLPVVLTAGTQLGTINHTLLSVEVLKMNHIPIAGIVFNRFEGTWLERNNIKTIQQHTSLPSLVLPKLKNLSDLKHIQIENTEFFERIERI
ncbi:dethiobiotin synthase [Niallia sp. 03133]|uniref:dethiobiotin synthase n=1 Tax=Niallia sp. 03133 TaxID=3458060 RepID=UPI004043E117